MRFKRLTHSREMLSGSRFRGNIRAIADVGKSIQVSKASNEAIFSIVTHSTSVKWIEE